ncbi:endonuclease [Salinisphaera orenii YIM 95161]|uniref:Endonuclease n=2 Tax=Salinisphaera TaxID=180541 RepID=A0A423PSS2_9GAMM|nr:endonuclease [Salinisphaera halophila YIM 95161]
MMQLKRLAQRRLRRASLAWTAALGAMFPMAFGMVACGGAADAGGGDWPAAVGAPEASARQLRRLVNPGFTVGYDTRRGRAAWVAYRVTPVGRYTHRSRPDFIADPRLDTAPETRRYGAGRYDRGHLAPNYAIGQLYGDDAQRASFYYSNVVPQRSRLNQLVWQRIEEIETDEIAPATGTLWVLVGPVPAASDNAAPAGFYRIWLARDDDSAWRVLAFRVPQSVRGDERLDSFIVSVDAIEAETGLDFMPDLAAARERALEARPAVAETFGFAAHACQPARYGERWQGRDGVRLRYDRCGAPMRD